MATAAKFVQPIPIFFVLTRFTRCGCCSYQVSSISVWRVTCYDNFCVFKFYSIFAVSMATAAILNKSTLKSTTSHGIWYSYKVSLSLIKAFPRNRADKNVWKNNNNSEKETYNNNTSPDNSRGDVIIIRIIRNGANTICLPNFIWGHSKSTEIRLTFFL
jgi:hypothetical protein